MVLRAARELWSSPQRIEPEDLDEALMRPGRFDRKVYVPYPDMKGRRAILKSHAQGKPIQDEEKALDLIAQTTPGMSGAELANLLNEAAIFSALNNARTISVSDLETARDKVRFGKERKSMVLKQQEREMVAYHEAGHTIVHLQTSHLPPLYKVSILLRGGALGVTTLLPDDEDQNLQSKSFLLEELLVLMGGRAAEKVFYAWTTNGAGGDLDMARKIARKMIHEWGWAKNSITKWNNATPNLKSIACLRTQISRLMISLRRTVRRPIS